MNIKELVYELNDLTEESVKRKHQEKIYAGLFDNAVNQTNYVIIADADADGLCAARIWREYTHTDAPIYFLDRSNRNPLSIAKTIPAETAIICLDCGSSVDWTDIPNQVFVIDHHESQITCIGVIYMNPKMDYHDTSYCTSTLLYALFEAMNGENQTAIQYAAIAGVADMVSMLEDNRNIVTRGFIAMNDAPCEFAREYPPFRAKYDEIHVGFTLAPLINAPSRLNKIDVAIKAIVYNDSASIKALKSINNSRKTLVKNIVKQAKITTFENCVIAIIDSGGAAISGLVANKLMSQYKKPVMCIDGNSLSMRSKTVDVERFITQNPSMISGGGHKQAAGGVVLAESEDIQQAFVVYCDINNKANDAIALYDVYTDGQLLIQSKKQLLELKPFGQRFQAPVFGGYFTVYQIGSDFATKSVSEGYTTLKLKSGAYVFNAKYFDVPCQIDLGKEYFFLFDVAESELFIKGIDNE